MLVIGVDFEQGFVVSREISDNSSHDDAIEFMNNEFRQEFDELLFVKNDEVFDHT